MGLGSRDSEEKQGITIFGIRFHFVPIPVNFCISPVLGIKPKWLYSLFFFPFSLWQTFCFFLRVGPQRLDAAGRVTGPVNGAFPENGKAGGPTAETAASSMFLGRA
jgi:hypothetical protein